MIRRKKHNDKPKTVHAILTSDWHLREDQPECRMDDFWEAQWKVVNQIKELQEVHDCQVVIAGDLFHHWKPSPNLISKAIEYMPKRAIVVYGQHDLPQHNFELRHKSGIYTLEKAGVVTVLKHGNWGSKYLGQLLYPGKDHMMGVLHRFVWDGKKIPWPGCDEITANDLMDQNEYMDIIVTGDHHRPFVVENEIGQKIVNCGCLTRQTADYAKHRPRVYLYCAEDNSVTPHYLRVERDVISREHIEVKKDRDKRIEAFISRMSNNIEISNSFEDNLKRYLSNNRVRKNVKQIIYKSIDNG